MARASRTQSPQRRAAKKESLDLDFRPTSYRWPRRSRSANAAPNAGEVVIARIRTASTHGDVITLRAKRTPEGRILFSMAHEDSHARSNRRIRIKPKSAQRPLAFRELVELLDSATYDAVSGEPQDHERFAGVIWGTLQLHHDHGIDDADGYLFFTSVTSEHYPKLEAYYRDRLSEWCLDNCIEEEDCRKIVRMQRRRG